MNAFRIRVLSGCDRAIQVRSTVDKTWKLYPKTDEQCQFGDNDLINIKNFDETKVLLKLKTTKPKDGWLIVRSSRRGAFKLTDEEKRLWFDPGEVLTIRHPQAQDPLNGSGPVKAV